MRLKFDKNAKITRNVVIDFIIIFFRLMLKIIDITFPHMLYTAAENVFKKIIKMQTIIYKHLLMTFLIFYM